MMVSSRSPHDRSSKLRMSHFISYGKTGKARLILVRAFERTPASLVFSQDMFFLVAPEAVPVTNNLPLRLANTFVRK